MSKINSINNKSSELTIDPGASGDSFVQFDINATGKFRIGVDETDDSFCISIGSALGTSDAFIVQSTGEIIRSLQPAYNVSLLVGDANVTGDGSIFTIGSGNALTANYNVGSNFSNPSFTAPKTGIYFFNFSVGVSGYANVSYTLILSTTSNDYYCNARYDITANGYQDICSSLLVKLTAADTVALKIVCSGGSKAVDINSSISTYFIGTLIC